MRAPSATGRLGGWTPDAVKRGAWGAAGLAALLALWPPRGVVPIAPPLPPTASAFPTGAGRSDGAADSVVRGNLLSARRQAPTVRYRDPLAPVAPEAPGASPTDVPGVAAGGAMPTEGPELLGIAEVDGGWRALVRWAPGRPALWCRAGARCDEDAGGGRVRAVTRDAVTLEVAGAVRTLRLPSRRPVDSMPRVP